MMQKQETIAQCLHRQSISYPDRLAILTQEWQCSYEELNHLARGLAGQMRNQGIGLGQHVAIWGINSEAWIITYLALGILGAVPILLSTCTNAKELASLMDYANVTAVYYGDSKDEPFANRLPEIQWHSTKKRCYYPMWNREEPLLSALEPQWESGVQPEHPGAMLFTSGTTAQPKGVVLSQGTLLVNAQDIADSQMWSVGDKLSIFVPMFHSFGLTTGILASIQAGICMCPEATFRTQAVWDSIERLGCTILLGVPSMYLALVRSLQRQSRNVSGIKHGIIAGAPVTETDYEGITKAMPNIQLHQAYGQTETAPCVCIATNQLDDQAIATSAGRPLDKVSLRVVDPKTQAPLALGEIGALQVQGYNLMMGYYHMPEATAQCYTEDGWFITGDLGFLDDQGCLHVTGRIKDIIIRGGENISPAEIESVLNEIPWVSQSKAFGMPAPVIQEEVVACIVPSKKQPADWSGLAEHLSYKLCAHKRPVYIVAQENFPVTATGKVDTQTLKKQVIEKIQNQSDHYIMNY